MNLKNILITGANGLLGQKLCRHFSSSFNTIATDLQPKSYIPVPNLSYQTLDITDGRNVDFHVRQNKPSIIINAAAYTDVDGCEIHKDQAWTINVGGVRNLVKACQDHEIKLIQLSTDYVFDGENGPYFEDDPPNPVGFYGQTKLDSEKIIQDSGIDFAIVRTNVLYGFGENVRKNFLLWLLDQLSTGEKLKIVTDQFNNPTLADNLSECIMEYLSRYDFAVKAAKKFGYDTSLISPTISESLEQKAQRPSRGGLKIEKAQKLLKTKLLNVEEGLDQIKK
jgi:dTDP-4-dehydrorhamnose reductase